MDLHQQKRHPMKVVSRRAGLSQDVLRAWEKRYGAVSPGRSGGGQRLYSDADVERLRLLGAVVSAGRRISVVAGLPTEQLEILALEDQVAAAPQENTPEVDPLVLLDAMDAIARLDGPRLREILLGQLLRGGTQELIEGLVAPLMVEVGRQWHEGRLSTRHEHLATEVLRGLAAKILAEAPVHDARGTVVLATPAQQRHEVGGLMAAATAAQSRWRVVYLGADLPARDIIEACAEVEADVLALSYAYEVDAAAELAELRTIAAGLSPSVRLVVGGAAASRHETELRAIGASVVPDLLRFREVLLARARPESS